MRTDRNRSRLVGEGGCLLPGGMGACSRGGGCLLPGWGGIPVCTEADPPCGRTDRCKNITFATSLRTVKILEKWRSPGILSVRKTGNHVNGKEDVLQD